VAENQPANKNRMNQELSDFAARLRERFLVGDDVRSLTLQNRKSEIGNRKWSEPPHQPSSNYGTAGVGCYDEDFNSFALELFALQLKHNPAYRKICAGRKLMPGAVEHWTEIPVVPTAVFKELELTSIPPAERTAVFHSSGTTEQKPSRHFHHAESLAVYEASLLTWFQANVAIGAPSTVSARTTPGEKHADTVIGVPSARPFRIIILTPPPARAPHSSLVHMFETIRSRACESADNPFFGTVAPDGSWTLDFDAAVAALNSSLATRRPSLLSGTAFSFVHLLDYLAEKQLSFRLPPGSRVMETGGYKGRSRAMPKAELHALITERLGIPPEDIICEYGMSELSSQAYDAKLERRPPARRDAVGVQAFACSDGMLERELQHAVPEAGAPFDTRRHFHFPPWARVQIISPETGGEVAAGETGLIRVFDLANVFSMMAVQTEDLGLRRGDGFELIGRAAKAEARGCSLMAV
jgi:hypothetical protein